ncbi:type IV secretory system conjugative DNA transfer family protein [Rhodococcus triatomae]
MAPTRRDRPQVSSDTDMQILTAIAIAVPASFLPVAAYHLGGGADTTWNPITLAIGVGTGKQTWPATATGWLIGLTLLIAVAVAGILWVLRRTGIITAPPTGDPAERRVDALATTMTNPREVAETNPKRQTAATARLAPAIDPTHPGYRGILMGRTVIGDHELRMPWEWVCVAIAGARMGKSAALAIPAACSAPGALIATSNKKDIYTHSLHTRQQTGTVWLFDLQGVTTGHPQQRATFWFNPLGPVVDLPSANTVGDYFVSAATDEGSRVDSYFDGNARDLFGAYILAAALIGGDIRHVVEWLTNTQSQVPVEILRNYGYPDLADTMIGKQQVNAKQRDGFYDMARRFLAPLDEPRFAEAVLPPQRIKVAVTSDGDITTTPGAAVHTLPELDPTAFVHTTDTVYAMSKEGPGSASAIAMALIGAILDAAQHHGARQPSGRLPIPLVAVLDEAANVCRLQQLPDWYSHFGSRGIIPITILQSPSQGKAVWGETKFNAMLDASNLIWYGGNVSDDHFITALSNSIGSHHVQSESRNRGGSILSNSSQSSVNQSWQKEKIFDDDDLKALAPTRAIIQLAGSKPLLVKKAYWSHTVFADDIRHSLDDLEHHQSTPQPTPPAAATTPSSAVPGDTSSAQAPAPRPIDSTIAPPPSRIDDLVNSEFFTQG